MVSAEEGVKQFLNQKVSKRRSRASRARSVKKVSKNSPNTDFGVFLTHFRVIWDFFDSFLTLRARRPRNTFLRLFGGFRAQTASGLLYTVAENVSCSRATQTCTGAILGLSPEQETFRNSRAFPPKDYLLLLLSISGQSANSGLYQAIRVSTIVCKLGAF